MDFGVKLENERGQRRPSAQDCPNSLRSTRALPRAPDFGYHWQLRLATSLILARYTFALCYTTRTGKYIDAMQKARQSRGGDSSGPDLMQLYAADKCCRLYST